MGSARSLAVQVGVQPACSALGVSRATYYRRLQPVVAGPCERTPPLKLSQDESSEVLNLLYSPRFMDSSPRQMWATLLDEDGRYLCSVRTMYRLLERHGAVRDRRDQLRHPKYVKPELLATGPNQVWSWDITKLRGPSKGSWYYLYLILDVFSRCVVGWLVAHREEAVLAKELIRASLEKQGIDRDQLTLHADRGSSMTSKSVARLLSNLGVVKSHSRPYTSNDNPYSESQFKTLKYHPSYPERFGSLQDAGAFLGPFLRWYNTEHRHGHLALLTPADVHYGRGARILETRAVTLQEAYWAHPSRFKGRVPAVGGLPEEVWINPPKRGEESSLPVPETPGPEQLDGGTEEHGQRTMPSASADDQAAQLSAEPGQPRTLEIAH